jgi:hypothetical protein
VGSFWDIFKDDKPTLEASEDEAITPAPPEQAPPHPPQEGLAEPQMPATTANASAIPPPAQRSVPYGIDDAIRLMRALPVDDRIDLMAHVIKTTLESLNVHVSDIVADAIAREESLRGRITQFQAIIARYEREIEMRRQEIARLEAELAETTNVRERLRLAESGSGIPLPLVKPAHAPASVSPPVASTGTPGAAPASSSGRPPMPAFRPRIGGPKSE